jgi:hypothetical protein
MDWIELYLEKTKKTVRLNYKDDIGKMIELVLSQRDYKGFYESFLFNDFEINEKGFNELNHFCKIHNVSAFGYIEMELIYVEMLHNLVTKTNNSSIKKVAKQKDIFKIVIENLEKYLTDEDRQIREFMEFSEQQIEKLIDTSFEVAKDNLNQEPKIQIANYKKYENATEDLENHINIIKSKLKNKRVTAKIKDSYLKKIILDDMEYSKKYNYFYFKNYTDGLILGYSQRAFLFGVDKDKAIRELENNIKSLANYGGDGLRLIEDTNKLIDLIKQKKHKEKIAFKTIAKKLSMTTNEAMNFTKALIAISIYSYSFKKYYNE